MAPSKGSTKGKGQAKPKVAPVMGVCEFSGQPCSPRSLFKPGYDAKLKSALGNAGVDGDVDAVVELLARDWPIKKAVPADVIKKAKARFKSLATGGSIKVDGWLDKRVSSRLAKIKRGAKPENAVRSRAA